MNYGAESFSDDLSEVDLNALSLGGGARKTRKAAVRRRKSKSRSRSRGRTSTGSQSGGMARKKKRSGSKARKSAKPAKKGKSKSRSRSRSKSRSKSRSRSRSKSAKRSSSQSGGRKSKSKSKAEDKIYSLIGNTPLVINTKTATDAAKKFASKMLRKGNKREGKITVRFKCLSPGKTQNYEYVYDLEKKKVKSTSKIGKKSIAGKDGMVSKFVKIHKVDKIRPNSK